MPIREPRQPLAYSVNGAAEALGISPRKIEDLIKEERLFPRWIDGKRVFLTSELLAWLETLPYEKPR